MVSELSKQYMAKHKVEKPADVLVGKFNWSDYLQGFLHNPGVVVSKLHPLVGLRLAGLYTRLMIDGHAEPTGPRSETYILSGVRLRGPASQPGTQEWFWNRDLRRNGGRPSGGVANPHRKHGPDPEGIQRMGSNHMTQKMPAPWNVEVGYATDHRTQRGGNDAAWAPVHNRLAEFGLDWPLKPGRNPIVERWHIEPGTRRTGWIDAFWPKEPGVHRPLIQGFQGGDVKTFQAQAGAKVDGDYGPASVEACKKLQWKLGRSNTGVWTLDDQKAFRAAEAKGKPRPPVVQPPAAKPDPQPVNKGVDKAKLKAITDALDAIKAQVQDLG